MNWWRRKPPAEVARQEQRAESRRALDEAGRAIRAGAGGGVPERVVDEREPDERRTVVSPPLGDATAVVVAVTSRRAPGTAPEKSGDVLSPRFLAWVRSLPCAFCAQRPQSDPHHFPTKGSLGMTIDLLALPACRGCHDKAHAGAIGKVQQCVALIQTLVHFFTRAPRSLKREVFTEIAKGLG